MDIRIKGEVDQPDLVLDIEEEDGEFFLVATDKNGTKYDLIVINSEDEFYKVYPDEFRKAGLGEV